MDNEFRPICRVCGIKMTLRQKDAILDTRDGKNLLFGIVQQQLLLDIYLCPQCRRVELFMPLTPAEEFDATPTFRNDAEKFAYNFRNYTDKQLQKVIDGKDYVPNAKKAARNLLYKRKYKQEDDS